MRREIFTGGSKVKAKKYGFVILEQGNGHGNTNTKIRAFNRTVVNNPLGDFVVTQNTDSGDFITINNTGIYNFSYGDGKATGDTVIGISVNSASLTTNVQDADRSNVLTFQQNPNTGSSNPVAVNATTKLKSGDVVRAHTDGTPDVGSAETVFFRIERVA